MKLEVTERERMAIAELIARRIAWWEDEGEYLELGDNQPVFTVHELQQLNSAVSGVKQDVYLFTPSIRAVAHTYPRLRAHCEISPADYAKIRRGQHWSAVVTDHLSGLSLNISGEDCGSPGCFCAAVITGKAKP